MISPLLRNKRMPSKQTRVLLTIFIIRNSLGLLAFLWMIQIGHQVGGIWAWLFPVLGVLYFAGALFNGNKLYQQYRRTQAKEKQEAARNAAS